MFTAGELDYARARRRPAQHLAARFCAKEAAVKALGLTAGFGLREVEVVGSGPPSLRLRGRAAQAAADQGVELRISLTHARDYAAAVVLAETR